MHLTISPFHCTMPTAAAWAWTCCRCPARSRRWDRPHAAREIATDCEPLAGFLDVVSRTSRHPLPSSFAW